jgi:transposase
MIDPGVRNAIYQLHLAGRPVREISRQLKVNRHTVRTVIRHKGAMPQTVRRDKIQIDPELLRRLYEQCDGWVERVHEKLVEEEGLRVSYSTLTRIVRQLDLGNPAPERCQRVVGSRIVPRRSRPLWSRRFPGRAVESAKDFDESPQGRSRSVERESVGNGTGTREEEATRTFF